MQGAILGVSCDYHDAAAALCVDGRVVAAAEQERFSRRKHDSDLPVDAIESCLAIAGIGAGDLEAVVFHEKPLAVLGRVLATHQSRGPAAVAPFVREVPTLIGRNLMIGDRLDRALRRLGAPRPPRATYVEHHVSHAAAAFYPSPFDAAAILVIDGVGEWATASIGRGSGSQIDLVEEVRFPNSLGLLYSLVTWWCGFTPNDDEYKVMGLAPYGTPRFRPQLDELVQLQPSGAFRVDASRLGWWSPRARRGLARLFDGPPRRAGEALTEREVDLAASVQQLLEEAVRRLAERAAAVADERRLVLAGGVALNCAATGKLLAHPDLDAVWVQPAASDAGSAMGAALWSWHRRGGTRVEPSARMRGTALGPRFADDEVRAWLDRLNVAYRRPDDEANLVEEVAARLAGGEIVGWFEGRMEFGPRALGHRSILADARSAEVQDDLNLRVKGREGFRPFAPSVPWEQAREWFALDAPSPYMSHVVPIAEGQRLPVDVAAEPDDLAARVRLPRSTIPACTHVDGTARVQTVAAEDHPRFHALLEAFGHLTGCPVLLNTSMNVAGEPIACTPADALSTAARAGLDALVLQDVVVERAELERR